MASADQTVKEVTDSRNWLELPHDVTRIILMKLDSLEILETAQFVCKLWYNLCKDPSMWRVIKIHNYDEPELQEKYQKLLYNIVDRSSSELTSLDIDGFGSDDLISYISDQSSQLKHLRLACCHSISADVLIDALNDLSQLAELELTLCTFPSEETNNTIIRGCPFLKTFKLNQQGSRNPSFANDDEAFAIAETMHELQHLQLIGNSMTNDGLKAILDECQHLQSLDLRACFHVDLAGDLGKRCAQYIKNFCRPWDATDDYGFLTTDYDSDYDETYAFDYDDMDFVSDDQNYEFSDIDDDEDDDDDDDTFSYENYF